MVVTNLLGESNEITPEKLNMSRSIGRSIVLAAVAVEIFLSTAFSALAISEVATYGTIDPPAPKGYLGCVATSGWQDVYCFKVHEIADGPDAGKVDIFAKAWRGNEPTFIEHEIVPGEYTDANGVLRDTLEITYPVPGRPEMKLTTSVYEVGEISIRLQSYAPPSRRIISEGCVSYPINYELFASSDVIHDARFASGSVGGDSISEYSQVCDSFFVGPTSGIWRMVGL